MLPLDGTTFLEISWWWFRQVSEIMETNYINSRTAFIAMPDE